MKNLRRIITVGVEGMIGYMLAGDQCPTKSKERNVNYSSDFA